MWLISSDMFNVSFVCSFSDPFAGSHGGLSIRDRGQGPPRPQDGRREGGVTKCKWQGFTQCVVMATASILMLFLYLKTTYCYAAIQQCMTDVVLFCDWLSPTLFSCSGSGSWRIRICWIKCSLFGPRCICTYNGWLSVVALATAQPPPHSCPPLSPSCLPPTLCHSPLATSILQWQSNSTSSWCSRVLSLHADNVKLWKWVIPQDVCTYTHATPTHPHSVTDIFQNDLANWHKNSLICS